MMKELRPYALFALPLISVQAIVLYLFGQPLIAASGEIHLWWGTVLSSGNSQHLTDWYTFSHVIHGFLFYLGLWYFFPHMSVWMRLVLALGIEIAWEILENTPMVIDHYRQQALAQGYIGDSIINSISDTLAMALGFFMAWRLPVWSVVLIGIGLELFVAYSIRDNLILNIIGFVHQFPIISEWQSGG
ncbi:hypothetical protein A3C18_00190 [Candidatus Kaiserbacteria bacterium RIFCSPHIGHO2_02_FULL_54_11b]|uniref:DUF2585 family protein n=2 Tax=Candidatus Kaiseribacteriota TaxID=1752734 RepID=A0A1F6CMW7_9BACT|nr:MAG: hypothetical protein A2704_05340 [Candidatus Kaiserbacteria bacterium RIFCSPHIGHO2_01_FULL_54_36b]OGG64994.1 MAG: hypothetical protein A3C18_00190 [Candidatus Kaiserbacteria bacterium RIFCSPHIGHO2_02_FULL_54_11b]